MKLFDGSVMFWLVVMFVGFILANDADASGEFQVVLGSYHTGPSPKDVEVIGIKGTLQEGERIRRTFQQEWNEVNPGVVYHWNNSYIGCIIKNSESRPSIVAGKTWQASDNITLSLGIATGYKAGTVVPVVAAHTTIKRLRVSVIPYYNSTDSQAVNMYAGDELVEVRATEPIKTYGLAFVLSVVL